MSVARQAKLILTLQDNVSGAAQRIVGSLQAVDRAVSGVAGGVGRVGTGILQPSRTVTQAGRNMRRQATDMTMASGAMSMGLWSAGKAAYGMEDTLNEIEGRRFGKRDVFNLANGTEMTKEAWRQSAKELVSEINRTSPRTATEIAKAYGQLVQAGLDHEQVHGILPTAIDFAIAANYDTEEAADRLTNVITAMQLPQATFEQAEASARRAADVIAYTASHTNSSVAQMTEAFKYAAPSAAALGLEIEQLAAMFSVQAKRGIKGSEAGVAVRSMLTRMVRPTNMAAAALERYNIDLADYLEKSREIEAGDVISTLSLGGLDVSGARAEIDGILATSERTADKIRLISETIARTVGDQSTMSADTISKAVGEVLYGFGEELDVERLIADMQAANIATADFFRIFDVRQGARTLALFSEDVSSVVSEIRDMSDGFADVIKRSRMQGIVGAVAVIGAAMQDLVLAAADSGVIDNAAAALNGLSESVVNLSKVDPHLLEWGTYAAMATAAIAPLGFALTGLSAVAGMAINPIAWVGAGLAYLAYLNFDNINQYVRSFGAAVEEGMGPRTAALIGRTRDLMASIFQTHDFDATGLGAEHGSWFANFIEREIKGLEDTYQSFVAAGERFKGYWTTFDDWWNGLQHSAQIGIQNLTMAISSGASSLYQAGVAMVQSLWDGAVAKFHEFVGWLQSIPGRVREAIGRIDLSNIISWPSLPSWLGGGGPAPAPHGKGPPGLAGARAGGGPVDRGLSYLVGEKGPEIFTAERSGHIVPNHKLGGGGAGVTINATFNIAAGPAKEQAMEILRGLDRALSRSSQLAFSGLRPYGDP